MENNDEKVEFDLITAWEVVEHIHPKDLSNFFAYINDNLKTGGMFKNTQLEMHHRTKTKNLILSLVEYI